MTTKRSLDTYYNLLAEKICLLTDYRDTTLRMKAVLGPNNDSLLQGCIRKRQQLINRIEKIDKSILGLNPGDKPEGISGDKIGDEIVTQLGNLEKLLDDISELDNHCIDLAQAERNILKDEILRYQQKRQLSKGYRFSGVAPAKFVDTMIT